MFHRAHVSAPFETADLCDAYPRDVAVVAPGFGAFGGLDRMSGPIRTVQAFGDNSLVREAVTEPGEGAVLVVDGGAAMRWAMVGDRLARSAADNGWSGLLVNGCIRDARVMAELQLGVWALGTHPRRTIKRGQGVRDIEVEFGGVRFVPGHFLYADADGILVAPHGLIGDAK